MELFIPFQNTTLTFGASGVANLNSITLPGYSRESVPTHSLSSSWKTSRPSRIVDPGECTFEVTYHPTYHSALFAEFQNPNNSLWTITPPVGDPIPFSGHATTADWNEVNRDDEDNYTTTFTIKVSGPVGF